MGEETENSGSRTLGEGGLAPGSVEGLNLGRDLPEVWRLEGREDLRGFFWCFFFSSHFGDKGSCSLGYRNLLCSQG